MSVRLFSSKDITLENLRRVAWAGETVEIDGTAVARMVEARQRFMLLLDDPAITVYGVTSGYGQNAKKRLTAEERKLHAKRCVAGEFSSKPLLLHQILHSIDAAWNVENIRQLKGKAAPWVKEDKAQVLAQLHFLNGFMKREPDIVVLVTHDNEQYEHVTAAGIVGAALEV